MLMYGSCSISSFSSAGFACFSSSCFSDLHLFLFLFLFDDDDDDEVVAVRRAW